MVRLKLVLCGSERERSPRVFHLTSLPYPRLSPFPFVSLSLYENSSLELSELLAAFLVEGDADLLLFVVVEVAGVARAFELGDERRLDLKRQLRVRGFSL